MYENVFKAMTIGECEIKNRFVVPAMVTNYCTNNGYLTDRYIDYITARAKGGFGLIITEDYAVEPHGKGYECIPGLFEDGQIALNKKLTEAVHQYGAKIFCQMYHPGKQSSKAVNGNVVPVAPSAIKDPFCQEQPREITKEEIHQLVKDFGMAAQRAKEAGFDGIEIHAGHGYMIAEFLSPFINKRTDEYGGCFENRCRFIDEIYYEMRRHVGPNFPIQVRMSANEYVPGGRTEAESFQLARHLDEMGVDSINVSNGAYASDPLHQIIAPMFTDHALNMNNAAQIKKIVNCTVLVANRINNPGMADTLIAMNKCDGVCMGRGSICDPDLPNKTKAGKMDEINYCIGCLQGCEMRLLDGESVTCLVNPAVGLEYKEAGQSQTPKNVMVIGGGPAGLMAARTAAKRGHHVTVYEATDHLGGAFRSAAYPSGKGELATVVAAYKVQCERLGVDIKMNTEVTEEILKETKPDRIIVATGSRPFNPPIKGIEHTVTAESVLYGDQAVANGPVVVCGGGEVGCETAEFISHTNGPVTVLEMMPEILKDMMPITKQCLLDMMIQQHVRIVTNAKVKEITPDHVIYEKDGKDVTIEAHTVVSAFGYRAYDPLTELAQKYCDEVVTVGSAVKAGNALTAIQEGYQAGLKI